jgi:hypothetical protein
VLTKDEQEDLRDSAMARSMGLAASPGGNAPVWVTTALLQDEVSQASARDNNHARPLMFASRELDAYDTTSDGGAGVGGAIIMGERVQSTPESDAISKQLEAMRDRVSLKQLATATASGNTIDPEDIAWAKGKLFKDYGYGMGSLQAPT